MNYSEKGLEVLYLDKYLIAVNKPAGLVVQGARFREESLLELTRDYLKIRENREGRAFLAVVHRLDRPVSGVCLFARRSKTARKLFQIITEKRFLKIYLARVEGAFKENEGLFIDYLEYKDGKGIVVDGGEMETGKEAVTFFRRLRQERAESLLLLSPITGRKHQLRIALAKRGYPIVGDYRYGSKIKILGGKAILLHALLLSLPHPHLETSLELYAPLPSYFGISNIDKTEVMEFVKKLRNLMQRPSNQASTGGR